MISLAHSSNNMATVMCLININTIKHLGHGFRLEDINMDIYVKVNHLLLLQNVKVLLQILNLSGIGLILSYSMLKQI